MFRRFDQANLRMAKLRRYSARVFDDFKKDEQRRAGSFRMPQLK
jgi:hypothetical protein